MRLAHLAALSALAITLPTGAVLASGYDTPILYTARHIGMGGTAVGYVDDASALFHNPAGLSRIKGLSVMLNVSPLFGSLQASPSPEGISVPSETAVVPMFLGAVGYKVTEGLSVGVAVFPLGGGSGAYNYSWDKTFSGKNFHYTREDSTSLAFIEISPGLAYEFDFLGGKVRVGAGYRYTMAQFARKKVTTEQKDGGTATTQTDIDMELQGADIKGYRVGIQGTWGDLDIGMVYRSGFTVAMTEVERDDPTIVLTPATDVGFEFKLPSKLGVGAQLKMTKQLRLAADMELLFNSENNTSDFTGCAAGDCVNGAFKPGQLKNYAMWDDGMTMRLGAGYQVSAMIEARLGYVYDTKSASLSYPSAFGTPPGPTMAFTGGAGFKISDKISVSAALAYRSGEATVTPEDLPATSTDPNSVGNKSLDECLFCGREGTYKLSMIGAYVDCTLNF